MSYGPNMANQFGKRHSISNRILKGEKPSDLPVQQPTRSS